MTAADEDSRGLPLLLPLHYPMVDLVVAGEFAALWGLAAMANLKLP